MAWCRPHGMSGIAPSERWGHSSTPLNNKLYVFGGEIVSDAQNSGGSSAIYVFDLDNLTWTKPETKGKQPSDRWGHTANVWGSKIVIFGGFDGNSDFNDLCIFDTETVTWTAGIEITHGDPPSMRSGHSATLIDNDLYIFGGDSSGLYHRDIKVLNLEAGVWSIVDTTGVVFPRERSGHSATPVGTKIYFFGGDGGHKYFNDVFCLDLDTRVWMELKASGAPPAERSGHSAVLVDNKIVIFGGHGVGENGVDLYYNDIVVLDLNTLEWRRPEVVPGPMPAPRSGHSASLSPNGREMFVFGGENGGGDFFYNDIYILDLVTSGVVPVPPSTIIRNLRSALNQREFSDLTIKTEDGKSIYAHKVVLFTNCPQFKLLYQAAEKEKKTDEIAISSAHAVVFALLEFLYTDEVNDDVISSAAIAIDLLQLADEFLLERLKRVCHSIIPRNINVENVAYVFRRSVALKARYLQDFAQHYIFLNFGAVARTEGFWALLNDREAVREFFNSTPESARIIT